jgi:hypothetical protein
MGGLGEEFKYHLVSWSIVCSTISERGLGIHNLRLSNQALLGKWLWGYVNEIDAWWKAVGRQIWLQLGQVMLSGPPRVIRDGALEVK